MAGGNFIVISVHLKWNETGFLGSSTCFSLPKPFKMGMKYQLKILKYGSFLKSWAARHCPPQVERPKFSLSYIAFPLPILFRSNYQFLDTKIFWGKHEKSSQRKWILKGSWRNKCYTLLKTTAAFWKHSIKTLKIAAYLKSKI